MTEPTQILLASLEGVKQTGERKWAARCPAHDDRHASLAISTADDGKVLARCFAGCRFEDIVAAAGCDLRDMFPRREPPTLDRKQRAKLVAAYDYRDEDRTLLFQVCRFEPKTFRQRRPDGRGGWIWSLDDVRRVLYRLPEIVARPDERVLVVEGEKDADRLAGLGLLATTCPGGAEKWAKVDDAVLVGRHVAIVPDHDEPGRKHAKDVARRLAGRAASVKIVELPGLPAKGDVSDWLDAGGDAARLDKLVEAAGVVDHIAGAGAMIGGDEPFVLVPGEHRTDDGEAIEVGNDDFAEAVIAKLPSGVIYRRDTVVGELIGDPGRKRFAELRQDRVRLLVDKHVRLGTHRRGGVAYVSCSRAAAGLVDAQAVVSRDVPELRLLTRFPVFAPGWSLAPPGFANGIYYDPPPDLAVEPICCAETINATLDDLLVDFPFRSEADRDNYVGLLLTPLIRPALPGNVPLHHIGASLPRTGKTKLAEAVLGGVILGRPTAAMQVPAAEDEFDKRIVALLLDSTAIVHLDNVAERLDSPSLASLLTAATYSGRLLGGSKMVTLPNTTTLISSGNNASMSQEVAKRTVPIILQPTTDAPEQRTDFAHPDLEGYVAENREKILSCLIGAVEIWKAAGSPRGSTPLGGFEAWARTVGGVMACLGRSAWLANYAEFCNAADPSSEELRAFVNAWAIEYQDAPVAASTLLRLADRESVFLAERRSPTENGKTVSFSRRVLARYQDAPVGRYVIRRRGSGSSNAYFLEDCN